MAMRRRAVVGLVIGLSLAACAPSVAPASPEEKNTLDSIYIACLHDAALRMDDHASLRQ
jgi:hypothetical protein